MPDTFVIKEYLEEHLAEVKGMLLTEYNEAETMELFKEDGRKEGIKEGIKEGEGLLAKLMTMLLEEGRVNEAQKAASDGTFRNELYKKYKLIP